MRLAILIGVSEYKNPSSQLPASKMDIEAVRALLGATEKYDEIIELKGAVSAAEAKTQIANTVDKLQGTNVDEVLFYYSGHGDFQSNEFYFVMSDFEQEKRRQTCLENSEVDNWLRSLKPELTIKFVDACHAGVSYVKDHDSLQRHLQKSRQQFKTCYFMFSSACRQYSYQDTQLSDFTRSLLEAIAAATSETVRYKDLIDFISDEFESNKLQTPLFVAQGNFTEVFTQVTPHLRETVARIVAQLTDDRVGTIEEGSEKLESLETTVKADTARCRSREQVASLLDEIKKRVVGRQYEGDFPALYELQHTFEQSLYSLPKKATIGEWLDKHKDDYFAEVEDEQEEYTVRVRRAFPDPFPEYDTRYRRKITGLRVTDGNVYHLISTVAKAKYPNIPYFNCSILLLVSKKGIQFFYFFAEYREANWDDRELKREFDWRSQQCRFDDSEAVLAFPTVIEDEFATWVVQQVRKRFS